jgi:hypothetical protein
MKKIFVVFISACLIISCSKSGNTNPLVGSWSPLRLISQYANPYSLVVEYDTAWGGGTTVEFRKDGGYYVNGVLDYNYTLDNNSQFTLTPPGQVPVQYHFTISAGQMKTWRDGLAGEQIKVFNPDLSGEFKMANVELLYTEFVKQ